MQLRGAEGGRAKNERERGRGVAGGGRKGVRGNGCISQSDSHTGTLKTLLYSTHRDEKRDDGSSGAGWENVGSMKTAGRSSGSAQSAWFLLRGMTVELGVAKHCLKIQTQTLVAAYCEHWGGGVGEWRWRGGEGSAVAKLVSSSTQQSHIRQVKVNTQTLPPLKSKSPRRCHSRRTGDARPCRLLFQGLPPVTLTPPPSGSPCISPTVLFSPPQFCHVSESRAPGVHTLTSCSLICSNMFYSCQHTDWCSDDPAALLQLHCSFCRPYCQMPFSLLLALSTTLGSFTHTDNKVYGILVRLTDHSRCLMIASVFWGASHDSEIYVKCIDIPKTRQRQHQPLWFFFH